MFYLKFIEHVFTAYHTNMHLIQTDIINRVQNYIAYGRQTYKYQNRFIWFHYQWFLYTCIGRFDNSPERLDSVLMLKHFIDSLPCCHASWGTIFFKNLNRSISNCIDEHHIALLGMYKMCTIYNIVCNIMPTIIIKINRINSLIILYVI